jgi:hypothetical protein
LPSSTRHTNCWLHSRTRCNSTAHCMMCSAASRGGLLQWITSFSVTVGCAPAVVGLVHSGPGVQEDRQEEAANHESIQP